VAAVGDLEEQLFTRPEDSRGLLLAVSQSQRDQLNGQGVDQRPVVGQRQSVQGQQARPRGDLFPHRPARQVAGPGDGGVNKEVRRPRRGGRAVGELPRQLQQRRPVRGGAEEGLQRRGEPAAVGGQVGVQRCGAWVEGQERLLLGGGQVGRLQGGAGG